LRPGESGGGILSYKLKIWSCIVLEWHFLQAGTEK
jgi:hypothetical protein